MNIGNIVTVTAKSQLGKNRIAEHGDKWTVNKVWQSGMVQLIAPDGYIRNVSTTNDKNWLIHV